MSRAYVMIQEHWMDGSNRIIGLSPFQYGMLLLGMVMLGIAFATRRKK